MLIQLTKMPCSLLSIIKKMHTSMRNQKSKKDNNSRGGIDSVNHIATAHHATANIDPEFVIFNQNVNHDQCIRSLTEFDF